MKKETLHIEFESENGLTIKAKQILKAAIGLAISEAFHMYNLKWSSDTKHFTDPEECL